MQKNYIINNYRIKKLKDKYLIITDHGSYTFLTKNEYGSLQSGNIIKNKKLFDSLKEKGIILNETNINKIIDKFKEKNAFLFQGTSLHIIIPTLRCNQKCIYCHASSKALNAKDFDMDKKTAKKVIDFIFQSPSEAITIEFQGGEPLLNFPIVKFIIEYARKLNKKYKKSLLFTIVTNLSLMDNKKFEYFIKNNIVICTSLDGHELLNDRNRVFASGEGTYNILTKWINKIQKRYKKRKVRYLLGALITITRDSLNFPKEIVNSYVNFGLRTIHLRFLNNLGDARPLWNKISYSAEEFIDFWKKAVDYIIKLNKKGILINERTANIMLRKILTGKDPNFVDLRTPCGAAIGQLAYNYNGDIYTCDEGRMISEDLFVLGNVKNNSYKEILTSEQTCGIIAASVNDVFICDNCVYKPYCGLCPICNYAEQGSIIGKIPETNRCKIFKAQFDYIFDKLLFDKEAREVFLKWVTKQVKP